jgi:hypothetical protein
MAGGSWDPASLPTRPGLYINFQNAAAAQIKGGARGVVAIPLRTNTGGTATAKTIYTVDNEVDATALFGAANIQSIKFALQAGAKEVLVYTLPTYASGTYAQDMIDMRTAFDAYPFNVFCVDGNEVNLTATEQDNILAWCKTNKADGKHFEVVFGAVPATASTDDQSSATGDTRSIRLLDDYAVNLISGVVINGVSYTSHQYASYIAGLIAGTAINKSITYAVLPTTVTDVTKRLTNSQIKTSLSKGSLVLVNDGEKVKVEQGITTAVTKIRTIRARQAVSTDITKTASDSYIGKLDNNSDGRAALISSCKVYLENLENNNVLSAPSVIVDPNNPPVGDQVYLLISYIEIDSMERVFLTINV